MCLGPGPQPCRHTSIPILTHSSRLPTHFRITRQQTYTSLPPHFASRVPSRPSLPDRLNLPFIQPTTIPASSIPANRHLNPTSKPNPHPNILLTHPRKIPPIIHLWNFVEQFIGESGIIDYICRLNVYNVWEKSLQ